MTRLFDASSIWEAALLKDATPLAGEGTTSLAPYELGNILWKHSSRETITAEEAEDTRQVLNRILATMQLTRVERVEAEALRSAVEGKITYYDASYLYAALLLGAELITEDSDLATAASREGLKTFSLTTLIAGRKKDQGYSG